MTNFFLATRAHVRNAIVCSLFTVGLAACGSGESSSGSSASLVSPSSGSIDRGSTTNTTTPATETASSGSGNSTSTASSGTATLDWIPPTRNSDGSALTDLAGYTVYYGTSPDKLTQSVKVANPGLSAFTVSNLTTGTWYFSVTSYSTSGVESARTSVVSAKI